MWGVTIRRETLSNGHRTFVIRYEVVRVYYSSIPSKRKKEHLNPTSIPVSMVSYTFWILEDTLSWYWYWELFLWDNPQAIVDSTAVHDVHENLHGCGCLMFSTYLWVVNIKWIKSCNYESEFSKKSENQLYFPAKWGAIMTSYEPGIHNIRGIQDMFFKQKHLDIEDLSFQAKVGYRETEMFILKLGD